MTSAAARLSGVDLTFEKATASKEGASVAAPALTKLHITEHTGRGVPRITEAYGKERVCFNENSIVVTVPFESLGAEVYGAPDAENRSIVRQDGAG